MKLDPLFVDEYPGDGKKDWKAFCAAGPPWHGAIFKCSQGTKYAYPSWLREQRQAFIEAAGDRYGIDAFEGVYHYIDILTDGAAQADFAMRQVDASGGEKIGTLWLMLDVERGGQRIANPSRAQVEDCTRAFAARYTALTGRTATLYGGELLRQVGVQDLLGCGRSAIALYGQHLTLDVIKRTGTDLEHLMLWQFAGADEKTPTPTGYPNSAPGCGKTDISAMVLPGGLEGMRSQLWAERPA